MKYNIVSFGDLHWGVMDPVVQFKNLEMIISFIKKSKMVDLVVINGDYYEAKIPLNSSIAILSVQWMSYLLDTAKEYGIKKVRMFKGTEDHDNSQLEVFRTLEDESGFFKLFNTNTYEETLPELKCLYCPDENINAREYVDLYLNNITEDIDIGFFHGSFDVVLPDIVVEASKRNNTKSIIYEYNFWKNIIKGPLISSHWHDASEHEDLIYIGSFDRWAFEEDGVKGFAFINYDTSTSKYYYRKIENINALLYITFKIDTNLYNTLNDYNSAIEFINSLLKEHSGYIKMRILITVTDDKTDNDSFIDSVKQYYISNKQVKVTVKNKLKTDKKKAVKKEHDLSVKEYGFILDKKMEYAEKIREFILKKKKIDVPVEDIRSVISKYII